MSEEQHVRFEVTQGWGVITLDRPKALNSLTLGMVRAVGAKLAEWRGDDAVGAVMIRAVPGRAFCAGGDVLDVTRAVKEEGPSAVAPFFAAEYLMNWRIKRLPKPYVALIDGIFMGGGVGVSVHGSHRVVTENALFAMPETGIGLFPDVGGSHLLPRLAPGVGEWLGLTGARLKGAQALAAGVGTHFVPAEALAELERALLEAGSEGLDATLGRFAVREGEPLEGRERIERTYAGATLEKLKGLIAADESVAQDLAGKSPLSVAVVTEQLRRGAGMGFDECMRMEYALTHRFAGRGDFVEGVRALLVDKDKNPRWRHGSLNEVTDEEVAAMFEPLPEGQGLRLGWG